MARNNKTRTRFEAIDICPSTAHGDPTYAVDSVSHAAADGCLRIFAANADWESTSSANLHAWFSQDGYLTQQSGGVSLAEGIFVIDSSGNVNIGNGAFTVDGTTGAVSFGGVAANDLAVAAAAADTIGTAYVITGGEGGVATAAGQDGGMVQITGGLGSAGVGTAENGGNGALVYLLGGDGGAGSGTTATSGSGGGVTMVGGPGKVATANTGSGGAGGYANMTAGTGGAGKTTGTGGTGGLITIIGGTGGASGAAGTGGDGSTLQITSGDGGLVTTSGTGGAGGIITVTAGIGGQTATGTAGAAGTVTITSGAGGACTGNGTPTNGGLLALTAGNGGAEVGGTGAVGGAITLTAGTGGASTTGGAGGAINAYTGVGGAAGGAAGAFLLKIGGASGTERIGITGAGVMTLTGTNFAVDSAGNLTTVSIDIGGGYAGASGLTVAATGAISGNSTAQFDGVITSGITGSNGGLVIKSTGAGATTFGVAGATGIVTLAGGTTIDNNADAAICNITEATVRVTGILDVTSTATIGGATTVSAANATTNTAVRAIIGSIAASGTGMTANYLATGVRGIVTMSGTTTGQAYYYGTQGKWVAGTGSFAGGSFHTALCGQLDLTGAATYTSVGCISGLWVDAGATAHANAVTAGAMINMVQINNTTSAVVNSAIKFQGYATYFLDLSDGGGGVGNCITAGGSDCTASGATDPSYTIKVRMAGAADGYIRVWATP